MSSSGFSQKANSVVIVGAARTPVGSFRGSLASLSATDLGAAAVRGAFDRVPGLEREKFSGEVILGNVLSAGLGQAPAKQVALAAGLPTTTVCSTVNKVCASGMKAVMLGTQSIALGHQNVVIAGGMESMSNAPYILSNARSGYGYGHAQVEDSVLKDGLWDAKYQIHMGDCAELTAERFGITRAQQDAYAIQSYKRAAEASESGKFAAEIVPIQVSQGKGKSPVLVAEDEEFRRVDFSKVPNLRPAFPRADGSGTVTAANASTLNDGASAVILMSESSAISANIPPLCRILSMADAELDPRDFTIAPASAIPLALERAGLTKEQVDLWEINEAFSVVALANQQILGLDPGKVNIAGGGVSLGHPIGSSGCRIVVTLLNLLKPGQIGCAAVCNGGGGASAITIQKCL